MKNTIRCCISCILPCGALDVIRIVHTNGRVEEISGAVTAAEIMKLHPKHVLKKPSSAADGMCPKIIVVPPDAQLQRGKIYFLMPLPPQPQPKLHTKRKKNEPSRTNTASKSAGNNNSVTDLLISDRYLSEILSEKVSSQRDRRRGRGRVWRPHLDSITEGASDA
ncbi:uncharacterized protein LOC130985355 [Salvia miltiorrhiza]|uniref:uncharacterized protein LOC130985355 n=1 Tax=Salvia miltiorrhiza TaxID=226208 RepID=UPI0025AD6964|nr:uncharacterized protein LOC130985355 [Salvia miltiorrhiza]